MNTYARSHRAAVRASCWLDGVFLGEPPIIGGSVKSTLTALVPEAVDLTVPLTWAPQGPDDPLNKNGQEVVLQRGTPDLLEDLGTFRVASWEASYPYGEVKVSATSLAERLREARLEEPYSPAGGRSFSDVAEDLVDNILPLDVDPALEARTVPSGITWESERLEALAELADTWPARFHVTPSGVATFSPVLAEPTEAEVVASFTDGQESTVVTWTPRGTREGYYNAVIARGQEDAASGKAGVQAAAYLPGYGGPYGRVPYFYSSPLLTTAGQAQKAAQSRLAKVSQTTDVLKVSAVPDPRLGLADVVEVRLGEDRWLGRITELAMPLGLAEAMTVTVEGQR